MMPEYVAGTSASAKRRRFSSFLTAHRLTRSHHLHPDDNVSSTNSQTNLIILQTPFVFNHILNLIWGVRNGMARRFPPPKHLPDKRRSNPAAGCHYF